MNVNLLWLNYKCIPPGRYRLCVVISVGDDHKMQSNQSVGRRRQGSPLILGV